MSIKPNRAVALLTPLVFAPLAGSIAVLAAKYFPGVDVSSDQIQAVFIAGATIAFAKAGLWLKGWQDWEKLGVPSVAADTPEAPDLEFDPADGEDVADEHMDAEDIEDEEPLPVAA